LLKNSPDDRSLGEEWFVIGHKTACGDAILTSQMEPHAVFTAMHGEGSWEPSVVAPSLELFRECLTVFRRFAHSRGSPVELEANPPSEDERMHFIGRIKELTASEEEAWVFWAVQIETDPEGYSG